MATFHLHKTGWALGLLLLAGVACSAEITPPAVTVAVVITVDTGAAAQPTQMVAQAHQPTSTAEPLPATPYPSPLATAAATATPAATALPISLIGPLALLISEPAQNVETQEAAIFDLGTASIRPLAIQQERLFALQWLDDGCELYLNGNVYDLNGNLIWQVPSPVRDELGSLYTDQLSPEKNWLAYSVFSGAQTYDSTEFVDVAVISLSPPFASYRLTQHGGAEVEAFVWSADEKWLYYSDYDANGTLQVFRSTPDGQTQEQLTAHEGLLSQVDTMALSADGRHLAYGVTNLLFASMPYDYWESDEGWIGIIDLDSRAAMTVRLPKFGGAYALWWSADGDRLLVFGDSLPTGAGAPSGAQLHWIQVGQSEVPWRSIYQSQTPGNSISWVLPASDLETVFLQTPIGTFLLQEGEFTPFEGAALLEEAQSYGRIIDFIAGPTTFRGEAACQE